MRTQLLLLALVIAAVPAFASEEEIHAWRSAQVSVSTSSFGDVEVRATADATGTVKTLAVVVKGKTLTVPAKWLATLPAMPLAALEIRSERGYDRDPWLYIVFRRGATNLAGSVDVHLAIQSGKLKDASITTYDGKGGNKREVKKAP